MQDSFYPQVGSGAVLLGDSVEAQIYTRVWVGDGSCSLVPAALVARAPLVALALAQPLLAARLRILCELPLPS